MNFLVSVDLDFTFGGSSFKGSIKLYLLFLDPSHHLSPIVNECGGTRYLH